QARCKETAKSGSRTSRATSHTGTPEMESRPDRAVRKGASRASPSSSSRTTRARLARRTVNSSILPRAPGGRGHIAHHALERLLDLDSTRSLEQRSISRLQITSKEIARLFRRIKKERGAVRHSGVNGALHHPPCGAADAHKSINSLLRCEFSNLAVQIRGLSAKLQHLPKHGD